MIPEALAIGLLGIALICYARGKQVEAVLCLGGMLFFAVYALDL